MGRSWQEVKADKEAIDRANGRDVEATRVAARERTSASVLGYQLAELRKKTGLTQTDVATRMGVSQARISQLAAGGVEQLEVDTLRRYITAIGGTLKIVADIDGDDVNIATSQSVCAPDPQLKSPASSPAASAIRKSYFLPLDSSVDNAATNAS